MMALLVAVFAPFGLIAVLVAVSARSLQIGMRQVLQTSSQRITPARSIEPQIHRKKCHREYMFRDILFFRYIL